MELSPELNALTHTIIGAAIEVHRHMGPGLLESTYAPCMEHELTARRIAYVMQRAVPLTYKGMPLEGRYRLDLLVEDAVVVELKCIDQILPVHDAQLLTYLRLTGCPVGLLINFNVVRLVDGVRTLVNTKPGSQVRTEASS